MALNSKDMPKGIKFKVYLSKGEQTRYVMVYAPSEIEAKTSVNDSWLGTGWSVTWVELAQ